MSKQHHDDEMSDSEMWRAIRKSSQEKRDQNRQHGAARLLETGTGASFQSRNGGAHLIVSLPKSGRMIDYWPGTGLWIVRGTPGGLKYQHRGIDKLIAFIKEQEGRDGNA